MTTALLRHVTTQVSPSVKGDVVEPKLKKLPDQARDALHLKYHSPRKRLRGLNPTLHPVPPSMPPRRPGHNRSQSLPFRPRVEGSGGWRVIAQIFEGLPFCHTQRKGAANRRYTLPRKARRERKLQERNVSSKPVRFADRAAYFQ